MNNPFKRSSEPQIPVRQMTVKELVEDPSIEIIDVKPTHIVLADAAESPVDLRELGGTGKSIYGSFATEDYNPKLRGVLGLQIFDQMRKSDAQVKSSLMLKKTPVQSARWYVEPGGERPMDIKIARFIDNCLFKYMSTSWPQFLNECLLHLDFGYYPFEKVFAYAKDPEFEGKIVWQKFAPRHPMNVTNWEYDANGGPRVMYYARTGTYSTPTDSWGNRFTTTGSHEVPIPISKLLIFTNDKEAGNMEGVSVLRSAYKHWYYKDNLYKVDAIQKERHGIGIPIIKLPMGFKEEDKQLANQIGRNLRTNERAYITLPPMWEIEFADFKGNPVDAMVSIEHHDEMIARNVIGQFMGGKGSDEEKDLFIKSTRVVADVIRDVFNKYAIPELVNMNWPNVTEYPELRVRRIGETQDWRTLSFALRNLVGAGAVTPDDKLEAWLREEMDLPKFDPETARDLATPQGKAEADQETVDDVVEPAQPRLPRQSKANNMKQQAQGTGKTNAGKDSSGD